MRFFRYFIMKKNSGITVEVQYAQRGFRLFLDTTADDFSLSRTNTVDIQDEKANFRRDPRYPIVSTADKILKAVLKLLIKSIICFSRGTRRSL